MRPHPWKGLLPWKAWGRCGHITCLLSQVCFPAVSAAVPETRTPFLPWRYFRLANSSSPLPHPSCWGEPFKHKQCPSPWKMHQNTRDSGCSGLPSRTLSDKCKRYSRCNDLPPSPQICVLQHGLGQTAPEPSPLTKDFCASTGNWALAEITPPPLLWQPQAAQELNSDLQLTATHIHITTAKPQEKLEFWSCLSREKHN